MVLKTIRRIREWFLTRLHKSGQARCLNCNCTGTDNQKNYDCNYTFVDYTYSDLCDDDCPYHYADYVYYEHDYEYYYYS